MIKFETIDKNFKAGAQKGSTNYNQKVIFVLIKENFPPQAGKIVEALLAAEIIRRGRRIGRSRR